MAITTWTLDPPPQKKNKISKTTLCFLVPAALKKEAESMLLALQQTEKLDEDFSFFMNLLGLLIGNPTTRTSWTLCFHCHVEWYITPKGVPHLAKCNARATREVPSSKLKEQPPQRKIGVTSNLPVGRISVVTLIRTDTTLDHSQKAEKVCVPLLLLKVCNSSNNANGSDSGDASPPRGPGGPSRLSPRSNYFCAMCTTPPSGRLQGISV